MVFAYRTVYARQRDRKQLLFILITFYRIDIYIFNYISNIVIYYFAFIYVLLELVKAQCRDFRFLM
jgi:hypothetical protein